MLQVPLFRITHRGVVSPRREVLAGPRDIDDLFGGLVERFPVVYIVDLDAIERGAPNDELVRTIGDSCETLVYAGPRDEGDVIDILIAGATAAVVGTSYLTDPTTLDHILDTATAVVPCLDLGVTIPGRHDPAAVDPAATLIHWRELGFLRALVWDRDQPPAPVPACDGIEVLPVVAERLSGQACVFEGTVLMGEQ